MTYSKIKGNLTHLIRVFKHKALDITHLLHLLPSEAFLPV